MPYTAIICVKVTRAFHTLWIKKRSRPFIGIVLTLNDYDYYAPLTSPKPKHLHMKNQVDFLKINGGVWGAINFNNMIPIHSDQLEHIDIRILPTDDKATVDYKIFWPINYLGVTRQRTQLRLSKKQKNSIASSPARPHAHSWQNGVVILEYLKWQWIITSTANICRTISD